MSIFKFSLLRIVRNPLSLLMGIVLPIGFLIIPNMWIEGGRGYYWIAFCILLAAFPLTRGLQTDMKDLVVMRIMSTPTTTLKYLFQNLAACLLPLLVQIAFVCVFGMIRYDWTVAVTANLALIYLLFSATAIGFAYAWHFLFKKVTGEGGSAALVTVMIFSSVFGIMMPIDLFEGVAIGAIARLFPTYWISTGIDTILYTGGFDTGLLFPLAILTTFTALFLLYGTKRGAY